MTPEPSPGSVARAGAELSGAPARVLDVTDFGAVGDGRANDHPAIRRALYTEFTPTGRGVSRTPRFDSTGAERTVLYFPPGRYRIDGQIYCMLAYDNMHVVGAGRGISTLIFDQHEGRSGSGRGWYDDKRSRLVLGGHSEQPIENVSIAHLTLTTDPFPFKGSDRSLGTTVLSIGWATHVRVHGIEVASVPSFGMYVFNCSDVVVEDCHVHHTHVDGIHLSRSEQVIVRGNRVHDTGDDAIAISGTPDVPSRRVEVAGNAVARAGSNGISICGADGCTVEGNTVTDTYQTGIGIRPWPGHGGATNIVISANEVDHAGLYPRDDQVPEAPLWGGGSPCGIAVANDSVDAPPDHSHVAVEIADVLVKGNQVGPCRNTYVHIRRARNVSIVDNAFEGPLDASTHEHDSGEGGSRLGGSGVFAPPPPYVGDTSHTHPAVRSRDARSVRIEGNRIARAPDQRAVLIENDEVPDPGLVRVAGNAVTEVDDARSSPG